MSEENTLSANEALLQEALGKLRELNELTVEMPLQMRLEFYQSAKRHFYIGQCLTNRQIKEKNVNNKRRV